MILVHMFTVRFSVLHDLCTLIGEPVEESQANLGCILTDMQTHLNTTQMLVVTLKIMQSRVAKHNHFE